MYLLAIGMSSLEKYLSRPSAHFKIELFEGFLVLSCVSFLYILDINPLSDVLFANISSYSQGCLCILSMVSLAVQKHSSFALPGVVQWIEHRHANQRVLGLIPSQGTCLGFQPSRAPSRGCAEATTH